MWTLRRCASMTRFLSTHTHTHTKSSLGFINTPQSSPISPACGGQTEACYVLSAVSQLHPSLLAAMGGGFLISSADRNHPPVRLSRPAQPSNSVRSSLAGCGTDAFTIHGCYRHAVTRRLCPPATRLHRWDWDWATLQSVFCLFELSKNYWLQCAFRFSSAVYWRPVCKVDFCFSSVMFLNVFRLFTAFNSFESRV